MFKNIKEFIDKYEDTIEKVSNLDATEDEKDFIFYSNMYFAKAIMKDSVDDGESIAKIILATKGLSNEVMVKVE